MRKIVETTFMTLDGCIDNPQKWSPPYWDDEHAAYTQKLFDAADSLLLGRKTYEGFAEAWPPRKGDPFADRFNAIPKHVASRTLKDATWNATIIQGDAIEGVKKLKQGDGGDMLKYGTGEFSRDLLKHKLVDEYHFWIFPVVVGCGERLFVDGMDMTTLKLVDSTTFNSGIIVLKYAPK
jgi:dihydrofolate reductase